MRKWKIVRKRKTKIPTRKSGVWGTPIRDKIRQQLQVLRDLGLVDFLGGGSYQLR